MPAIKKWFQSYSYESTSAALALAMLFEIKI